MLFKLQTPQVLNHSRSQHTHRGGDRGVWIPQESVLRDRKTRTRTETKVCEMKKQPEKEEPMKLMEKEQLGMKTVVKKGITETT